MITRTQFAFLLKPSNFWLAARMIAWALVLPFLKKNLPFCTLIKLVRTSYKMECRKTVGKILKVQRWIYSRMKKENCLERSLLLFHFLSPYLRDLQIVGGLRKSETQWAGHAWILLNGRAMYDSDKSEPFVPVFNVGSVSS